MKCFRKRALAQDLSCNVTAVLLTGSNETFGEQLSKWADRVLVLENERINTYDSDLYTSILAALVKEQQPFLTLMGHTSWGMDYASALAARTGYPLATDATDILLEEGRPQVIRQMYGAFQHVAGITGADCVIAVNKDKKTPIFRVADYGIADDLFTVVEALKEKAKSA